MKKFVLELGKDFTFVGEEYTIQVGVIDKRSLIEKVSKLSPKIMSEISYKLAEVLGI